MKIYPSKHKIKSIPASKVDTSLNVPLAYIDIDHTKYKISKIVDSNFLTSKKNILYPGQAFDNKDFKIFNKTEEEVTNKDNLFYYNGNQYIFYPNNTIKFTPKNFMWKATVKRDFTYSISNTYNINIGCKYNDDLNQKLISAFMSTSNRNLLVHSNIKINNNDTNYSTFTSAKEEDLDFVFIKSHNCKHYDTNQTVEIDIDSLLNTHTNIWFGCEDAVSINKSFKMLMASSPTIFKISNPIMTKKCSVESSYYFDLSTINTQVGIKVHNIFDTDLVPALILEYENLGFIIITSYTVLDDPLKYEDLMYEIMMYVYTKTYESTEYINDWVTYKLPDYEISNGVYSIKSGFVSKSSIVSLLNLTDNYNLVNMDIVNVDKNNSPSLEKNNSIVCIGQNGGRPIFATNSVMSDYTEPDKPEGWKSVYYDGSIYYIEKFYYLIEENITDKIIMAEKDNSLIVKIYNFKSSKFNINKKIDTTIEISYIKTDGDLVQRIKEAEYTFYYIKDQDKIDFCYVEDYNNDENKYRLFNVLIEQTEDSIKVYDIRQLGGGLDENEPDDFELLDIGHINGRPYRSAGTLVLTMPSKYESHNEYIQNVIEKYKVAEDYVAIFYKDEEDE